MRALLPAWRTVLSAVLVVLAFPPWDFAWLIWLALVPWLLELDRHPESARSRFLQGVWLSVLMTLGGFHWVAYVLVQFGDLPWAVGFLGLFLLSLGNQPQFLVFAWARPRFERLMTGLAKPLADGVAWPAALGLALALAYTAVDWLVPKLFADTLGHALYRASALRQMAEVGGAWMLTFLVFLVNEAVAAAIRAIPLLARGKVEAIEAARSRRALLLRAAVVAAVWALFFAYGRTRATELADQIAQAPHRVQFGVIQANVGDLDKLAAERGLRAAARKVMHTYFRMSDQALSMSKRPEVLVWPETAYPSTFRTPDNSEELARDQMVEEYVRSRGVPLFFGGYDRAEYEGGIRDFNSVFLLYPAPAFPAGERIEAAGDLRVYHKNKILLFGEHIPGADLFPSIKRMFPQVGYFGRGPGPSVYDAPFPGNPVGKLRIQPIVCYEALYPDFLIEGARQGSQLILNVTNDSWFGPKGEPQLHLALSVFRSIETRLPQVRSTNTGVSALILPDGEIQQPTAVYDLEILNASVPVLAPPVTPIVRFGDWFGPLISGILAALVGAGLLVARSR